MASEHDTVLCYGLICVDAMVQLRDYPAPNGYTIMVDERECIGGDATNAGAILANLGNRVRLAGNRLGRDRSGRWLRARLARIANLDASLPRPAGDHSPEHHPQCPRRDTDDPRRLGYLGRRPALRWRS
jgi:sugar/nucleoside kinase (ribokinase family)